VRGRYDEVRGLGGEVLVISFEPAERLPSYRLQHGWPFPVVSDPQRTAYQAVGLGSAGWGRLLGPKVVARYAGLMLRGYRPRPSDADVHQLGGDFVIDAAHRLVYVHRSVDPADRPPAADLVRALEWARGARKSGGGGTS
jgi:AhpC/TSA antioxidant enzyme